MMKDPEVRKAVLGDQKDEELEELLNDLEVGEEDDLESLARKSNAKVKKLVKYFTKKMDNAEKSAEKKRAEDSQAQEDRKIKAFSDKNPGMKNAKVIALMQPLYNEGASLEDAYAQALKDLGLDGKELDPKTGEVKHETEEEKAAREKTEAEAKKKAKKQEGAKSSAKSSVAHDDDNDDDDGDDPEKDKPVSLDDALQAASSDYIAKHGNPFEKKEE